MSAPRSETPIHDWMRPRLQALVAQARAAGFDGLTATAVITDLIASTDFTGGEQAAEGEDVRPAGLEPATKPL